MTDFSQLPFLLKLLDDDTETVRSEVFSALIGMGLDLRKGLKPHLEQMDESRRQRLQEIWKEVRESHFQRRWQQWLDEENEYQALEIALSALALKESTLEEPDLPDQLDVMAAQLLDMGEKPSISFLMRFLFRKEGFGAPEREYYHAKNSNLVSVIQRKEGLQISLSCLAILLGNRVGLNLYGFNMPGHFMVMSQEQGQEVRVYDVFSEGRALHPNSINQLSQALELKSKNLDKLRARPHEIILRVLRNIIKAHERKGNQTEAERFKVHFEALVGQIRERGL